MISGRTHDAGRPRHRLVRAKGTRFRLAHAAALEPDPASAVADEWLVVGHGRRTEEDHAPPHHRQEGHERTQDDREAVHRAILDAARELFVSEGYQNVSIRKIAERIEYSPAAIYGYFPSKDDIFFALAEEGFHLLSGNDPERQRLPLKPIYFLAPDE